MHVQVTHMHRNDRMRAIDARHGADEAGRSRQWSFYVSWLSKVTPRLLTVDWHPSVDEPRPIELESALASFCHVPIQMNWVCRDF